MQTPPDMTRWVNEAMKRLYQEMSEAYPMESHIPLVVVIPVSRAAVKEARWRGATDRAIRQMMKDVIDSLTWPPAGH